LKSQKVHCRDLEIGCFQRERYDRGEYINQLTKEQQFGYGYDERVAGGRCSLRPPGASLEPENEGIHFRRAQRHLHYRSAKNAEDVSRSASGRVKYGCRRSRQNSALRRYQAPGPGCSTRGGRTLWTVLRESALAGRPAPQLP